MPADPADADRVVEVQMIDPFEFDPAQIEVIAGETVTFRVLDHEFVIGHEATQDEHETMMDDHGMGGEDEPNELALAGGASGELTWTFADATVPRRGQW